LQSDTELEEERRLMYVAITRAKEKLYITRARSRFLYGDRQATVRSRFLNELAGIIDLGDNYNKNTEIKSNYEGYNTYNKDIQTYKNRSYNTENKIEFAESKTSGGAKLSSSFIIKSQPTDRKDFSKFVAGVMISHTKFGEGRIISVKGSGANMIADVAFKNLGVKQLSVSLAPIKII
jgi:DNA helicase-2/ATP-dependent DNA helicase PcrA